MCHRSSHFLLGVLVLVLLSSTGPQLFSADLPLLAVPNIAAKDVAATAASVCRSMVEAALLKTGKFTVLSYTDVEEILAAQELSLSDCTDESCAIRLGKLLAADNIVVGELTGLGAGKMHLSLRLVNVTTGRTLAAEVEPVSSVETLEDSAFSAAYRLVGMRYTAGSQASSTDRGSVYVTAPQGRTLDVSVDGNAMGRTPLLIEDLSFGNHVLEATGDGYQYRKEISVRTTDVQDIVADVSQLRGNLYLAVEPADASGWALTVDGNKAAAGLLRDLAVGDHRVAASGGGWTYQGTATVKQDTTVRLSVRLRPAGTLVVVLPEGASARVISPSGDATEVASKAETTLDVGTYTVEVTHPDYDPYREQVEVKQNARVSLEPRLEHSEAYRVRQALAALESTRKVTASRRTSAIVLGIGGVGAAVVGLGIGLLAEYLVQSTARAAENAYASYTAATDPDVAHQLGDTLSGFRLRVEHWRGVRNASLVGAAAFALTASLSLAVAPTTRQIDAEIQRLRGGER